MSATPETAYERMFELAVVLSDAMDDGLAERGLTRSRAELLWRLQHQEPMTQRDLSDALRCTPRNVTGLLDGLQAEALVERTAHPTDRRATLVTLTDRGRSVLAELQTRQQTSSRELFAEISAGDLKTFLATLDHVLARLSQP